MNIARLVVLLMLVLSTSAYAQFSTACMTNLNLELRGQVVPGVTADATATTCYNQFLRSAPEWSSDDTAMADCLNVVRTGAANNIFDPAVTRSALRKALVVTELSALSQGSLTILQTFLSDAIVDFTDVTTQNQFRDLFPSATAPTTRANMIAIAKRQGSRMEVICGGGTRANGPLISKVLRGQ